MRSVSADFCARVGEAPAPRRAAARIAAPNLNCTRILPSIMSVRPRLKHASCQMALYYSLRRADHEHRWFAAAALYRDAAARVKPAARRDIVGIPPRGRTA